MDFNRMRRLAGMPLLEEDINAPLIESDDTEGTIKALGDTDYRDKNSFFKMVQLLKGLAAVADEDEKAKKYLSMVSDALTDVAGEMVEEEFESYVGVVEGVSSDVAMELSKKVFDSEMMKKLYKVGGGDSRALASDIKSLFITRVEKALGN